RIPAAGRNDELVSVHERGLAVAPARHHLAVEVVAEVFPPAFFALVNSQTNKIAADAKSVDELAVNGGRTARSLVVADGMVGLGDLRMPEFLPRCLLERPNNLVSAAKAHPENSARGDRGRAVAAAQPL